MILPLQLVILIEKIEISTNDERHKSIMTTTAIDQFPQSAQDDIKATLKVYSGVYVFRENGQYRASAGIALTGQKNPEDYKSWHIRSSEVYSAAEIKENNKALPDFNW